MFTQEGLEGGGHHPSPVPPFCPQGQLYTVVAGDTMFFIAQRFGVSLSALLAANPQITNPDLIFPGQVICLPSTPQPTPVCPTGLTYLVSPGETLFSIAQQLGVTVEELLFLNPQITTPDQIQAGDVLCVPVPVPRPCPPPPPPAPCPPWEAPPHPCPERPVVSPSPCPPREKERYPSVPGTPMPEPYYAGAFVYANPAVKWEDCPYHSRRRRRLRRRKRLF